MRRLLPRRADRPADLGRTKDCSGSKNESGRFGPGAPAAAALGPEPEQATR